MPATKAAMKDARVARLSAASLPYRDPAAEIPWHDLDPERPWLPERLISLFGLPEYAALGAQERVRLGQIEFAATVQLGLRLENILLGRFSDDSMRELDRDLLNYRYELHELREEIGHSLMFLELIERGAVPMLASIGRRARRAGRIARLMPVASPLYLAGVLIAESVPTEFHRPVRDDENVPAAIRAVVRLHTRDEMRHIAFAQLRLVQTLKRSSRPARTVYAKLLRLMLRDFIDVCFYPAPEVYRAAGLAGADRLARAARASAARAALASECVAPVTRFLRQQGVFL